jgi:hypothetical protein
MNQPVIIGDLLRAAPDVWELVCQHIHTGDWAALTEMSDAALADRVRAAVEKLSSQQRVVFDLRARDLFFPNMPFAKLLPDNIQLLLRCNIVTMQIRRDAQKQRHVYAHTLYEATYRRWDVNKKWPHVPDDYEAGPFLKYVFTTIVYTKNLDEAESQWRIADLNFVVMP